MAGWHLDPIQHGPHPEEPAASPRTISREQKMRKGHLPTQSHISPTQSHIPPTQSHVIRVTYTCLVSYTPTQRHTYEDNVSPTESHIHLSRVIHMRIIVAGPHMSGRCPALSSMHQDAPPAFISHNFVFYSRFANVSCHTNASTYSLYQRW